MKYREIGMLLSLGALWGSSYLFTHLGGLQFGPWPFAFLRAGIAAAILLPLAVHRSGFSSLRTHWRQVAFVGLTQSAFPTVLFCFALKTIPTGLSAILAATTPVFTAMLSRLWLGERLGPARVMGLVIGLLGVAWLVADKSSLQPGERREVVLACAACLGAATLYAISAVYTKQRAFAISPLALAAGSQVAAVLVLAGPALASWPAQVPSASAWWALAALALGCTALAYVIFYSLIARAGATRAVSVTYLLPGFSLLWGALFLHEAIAPSLLLGCAIVLLGTALANGIIILPQAFSFRRIPRSAP